MKKLISLFLSLARLLSIVSVVDFSAYADVQTGKLGENVTYSLDTSTGVLTISGTGDMYDYELHNYSGYYSSTPLKMAYIKNIIIEYGVTSIGDFVFFNCTNLTSVTISDTVTSIGEFAFAGLKKSEITIPNSVIYISYAAFSESVENYQYSYLKKINYNGTVTQWNSVKCGYENHYIIKCTDGIIGNGNTVTIDNFRCNINNDYTAQIEGRGTENLIIPETVSYEGYSFSVTSIGSSAFSGCTSLTSLTIPDSVTSIGSSAFSGCTSLTSVTIPDSVTSIGYSAFSGCTSLTSVTIGNGVTSIDNSAFSGCTSLTSLTIPDSVTSIGKYAFRGCTSLTSVTIPNSVTSIGYSAFSGCTSLTSVTIPDSVTSIGDYAFENCTNLTKVNYSGTVSQWKAIKIGSYNDKLRNAIIICTDDVIGNGNTVTIDNLKYKINNDYTAQIVGRTDTLGNLIIPEPVWYEGYTFTVTSIVNNAFSGCTSLTSVTIPNSVESIGDNAFQKCTSLTSATIGNNVTSIGSSAFFGCSKLKKIEIPDSVTYIGSKAFDGTAFYNTVKNWENGVLYCGNHLISAKSDVTKITVKASTVSIANGAFDNCNSLGKINVLNPKCVINCTIPKTAVIGGAEGSTAEDYAQKNNMSIDYFEECTHSDKVQVVIAATCTEQGAVQSRCADCDKLISQTFTAPLGHTMVITTPAKAPTCTTSGNTQAGYCTVCGYNEVSTPIPATGHNFGNNSANCLVCGTANPNYVAPTPTPTQPTQTSKPVAKPKSAKIKKVKAAKKAIAVEWKKVSGVKGYQIQVATDKKFKKNKKTVTVKKQKTTKVTVKKLKAKKKYYVRIRTYKTVKGKKIYSSWSKVKTVKTK